MNQESRITILYEDADVVVVNKPAGLVVHADGKTVEPALTDWVLENYPETKGVGEPTKLSNGKMIDRSGIVHRLDRETSGVMVVAKNQKAFEFLKKQFQEREMEKTYRAFVYGEVKNEEGVIDRPIARSTSDFRKWTATRGRRGQERDAVTEYKVLERFKGAPFAAKGAPLNPESFSFLEVRPKTGRTHQIRVHLKAINYPVVCDKLYASKRECALGFSRLALHAFSLKFKLPSGKEMIVEAPYPEDFQNTLRIIGRV